MARKCEAIWDDCLGFARIACTEQPALRAAGRGQAEMLPAAIIEAPPARGAGDQAKLDQVRLDHFFHCIAWFRQARRERFDPDRPAFVDIRDHRQIASVHRIEPERVNLQPGQRIIGQRAADRDVACDMREIAHPPQQPPGDPRCAARAPRRVWPDGCCAGCVILRKWLASQRYHVTSRIRR